MKSRIINIVLCILIASGAQAQSLKAFLNAGEEALMKGDYYNAMFYYSTAMEFDTTRLDIRYNYAEASREFYAYTVAENEFQYVLDNDNDNSFPLASYYLAAAKQNLGKYDEAKQYYQLYLSEYGGDNNRMTLRAEKELEAIEWAKEQIEFPEPGVTVTHLDNGVNTPYSEFGALEKDDELWYSSLRFEKETKGNRINKLFSKILSQNEDGNIQQDELNEYSQHTAHTAYNHDGTRLYFTLCDYVNDFEIQCDIYYSDIAGDNFGEAVKLPSAINMEGTTSTQPSISHNPQTGEEFIFFSSDRPDGKGGMDIWMAGINGPDFTEPVNLKNINTSEDELTPFYHNETGTLFFSSDGYLGMGGLDVYSSFNTPDGFGTPQNLRPPVNSSFNDLYYSINPESDKAYLSSNRTGSLFLEASYEACCYDIYQVDIEEIELDLNALTFNAESLDPLPGVTVKILDAITGEIEAEFTNPNGHEHKFTIIKGREYLIVSEREGFETDTTSLSTRHITSDLEEITRKIYLTPMDIRLEVFTFDDITKAPLNGVTVILEEIGDLGTSPVTQINMESNEFYFDIVAGRKYRLTADKRAYTTVITEFEALDINEGKIRKDLYLMSSEGYMNDHLPIAVFFDNDRPDLRSRRMYTDKTYSETYFPYLDSEEEFKNNFLSKLTDSDKTEAEVNISQFFRNDVEGGFNKLQNFLAVLKERLAAGDVIELTLNGYASPRAENRYNLALGQRRLWTLKNEIKGYEEGILNAYIEAGRLVVTEISLGEEIAPPDVSDSLSDKRQSIYSVEASKQRKAEIVKVRILNN